MVIPEMLCANYIWYLRFLLLSLGNTPAGGLLISGGIIRPVVSASALTWFIWYIFIEIHSS
jgi:hypothetical protein